MRMTKSPRTRTKTKSKRGLSRLGRAVALGAGMGAALGGGAMPAKAAPPKGSGLQTKAPELRTVQGMVSNKDGGPIQGAVVYLQDTKTMAVKSFLSDNEGHFHFRQLSMSADYGLWAELNGVRSKTMNISQFNSHPDLEYTLKLDVAK